MIFLDSDKLVAVASDNKFFTTSDFEQLIFRSNLCPIRVSLKIKHVC